MAAYCPKHGKDGLFKELGSEENGVTEVESVCMYCHENTYQDQDRMTLSSKMEETKPKIIACGTISRRTRSTFDAESEENTVEREDEEEDDPDEDCLWPSHKEDKLIQMYEERPFLYDITAEGYSNRRKKTMAHNEMSEKLGVTVKDVISRLKTLRNAFTRQTREVASGSGKKKLTERNRYIVKKLGFLKCHIRQRPSVSTYHLTKDPYEGMTKLMLTLIPHFREVVISSFHCEHCGFEDRSIQSGGRIHDKGVTFELTVKDDKDLNRQVVKSEWATLRIPEVDFEQPSRKRGEVNTVEGVLNVIINGLSTLQPARREQQPETAEKIDEFIAKLTRLKFLDEPFTLIIEDPSGSSYVENPYMPEKDPNMVVTHSLRTPEDNEILGLQNEDLVNGDAELEKEEDKEEEENEKVTEEDNLLKEVLGFKTNCPDCNVPCETNMKVVDIPFFKQSIIMATVCEACGYRENEVRSGSGIEPKGREITLKLTDPTDLSRDVLKSDTCGVRIPELEFELLEGTLGGRFTTIEGLLTNVKDQLSSKNPFIMGDSALTTTAQRIDKFCGKLQEIIDGKLLDIHIILDDPAGNSYIQNLYAPDPDPEMKTREYERSFEQNEELGLNDMKTDNYTNEPEPDS